MVIFSLSGRALRRLSGAIVPTASMMVCCDTADTDVRTARFGQWPEWSRVWNNDWDHRHPKDTTTPIDKKKTVHLIMVRHGQYDLKKEGTHGLTELGKVQATITGGRIADLASEAIDDHYGRRKIKIARVYHSDVTRAVETAKIISSQLGPDVKVEIDPMLAEGWPCLPEPYSNPDSVRPSTLFTESARIEAVFRKYCHRVTDYKKKPKEGAEKVDVVEPVGDVEEEYIVLVCHQNIIRYFVCRALQLPPEAWLRFRGSNCGITEIIISDDGRVALEKFADVGHLPVNHHTFH